jgi:hypothetical protein
MAAHLRGGHANHLGEIIEEALETSDDVDIHRRGTEILVYAHTQEGIRAAEQSLSRLLALRGISASSGGRSAFARRAGTKPRDSSSSSRAMGIRPRATASSASWRAFATKAKLERSPRSSASKRHSPQSPYADYRDGAGG